MVPPSSYEGIFLVEVHSSQMIFDFCQVGIKLSNTKFLCVKNWENQIHSLMKHRCLNYTESGTVQWLDQSQWWEKQIFLAYTKHPSFLSFFFLSFIFVRIKSQSCTPMTLCGAQDGLKFSQHSSLSLQVLQVLRTGFVPLFIEIII